MRQVVHIIRKNEMDKERIYTLKLELDYELATLYDAMVSQNESDIKTSKARLKEIYTMLEELNALG